MRSNPGLMYAALIGFCAAAGYPLRPAAATGGGAKRRTHFKTAQDLETLARAQAKRERRAARRR
ncbi:MAG: hypothetical protein HS122_19645 [Opitutaceae bacterium]|nr:hypothetical protein [Opitutaceae bacterium]